MEIEFEKIQKKIIEEFKLRIATPIDKKLFDQIYYRAKEIYEGEYNEKFLSPKEFAFKYLQITESAYKAMHGGFQNAKVLKDYKILDEEIENYRKKIIYENKLHRGDMKTYDELKELFNNNFIALSESEFFEKILDININTLRVLIGKKKKLKDGEKKEPATEILKKETIVDEEIQEIRKKCLKSELLHKKDKINYKKFREIYSKYYIPLSEIEFAEKILDINKKVYTKIKFYPESEAIILSTINLPENIEQIRNEVIKIEKLHKGDQITYQRFKEILDNNYYPISRVEFAKEILDITSSNLNSAKYDEKRNMTVLSNQSISEEEVKLLREEIIQKYKLHKKDKLTYNNFKEIYKENYIPLSEKEFAQKILDISEASYNTMKYENSSHILSKQQVKKEDIIKLRKKIQEEYPIGKAIDYEEFLEIYNKFYIPLSMNEYSEQVLEISKTKLKDMKKIRKVERDGKTKKIKLKTKIFLEKELENFRKKIIKDNFLYTGLEITRSQFMELYKTKGHMLSYMMFGNLVLGIDPMKVNALILGRNRKVKIETGLDLKENESNKEVFLEVQKNQIAKLLYEGKSISEITDELMLTKYDDINKLINEVILSKKLDENIIRKARVRNKIIEGVPFYKIAIKLGMDIDNIKKTIEEIIVEDVYDYMESGYTLEEALKIVKMSLIKNKEKQNDDKKSTIFVNKSKIKAEKRKKFLEGRIESILKKCDSLTDKQKEYLDEYISICKNEFEEGIFNVSNIDCLESALLYRDYNSDDAEFFIKICIQNGEYKRANGLISYYKYDASIDKSSREKLGKLYNMIRDAKNKQDAVKLVYNSGNNSRKKISHITSLKESDVITIEKEIKLHTVNEIIRELT